MWEVDAETKSKLLSLQKVTANSLCCDCAAPAPQWASPKFGAFICLSCAGLHRGLGVHISFVRSITMDAFKTGEMRRMEEGGNEAWRVFWEGKTGERWDEGGMPGVRGVEVLRERYGGEVGEEWKERLSAKVEGKDFVRVVKRGDRGGLSGSRVEATRTGTPRASTPVGERARAGSPAMSMGGLEKKAQNEAFFAKKGGENATRPRDLPPSQGGKYAGFGSDVTPSARNGEREVQGGIPGVDEFQRDPVAALTKGLGWFTTTVGKGAKTVNEGWIQPTAQKLAEADLASQARLTAAQVAQNIQSGTKGAAEQFNRFVSDESDPSTSSHITSRSAVDPDKKDFWDSFGEVNGGKGGAIGTAAMRKGREDGWDDDKWDKF